MKEHMFQREFTLIRHLMLSCLLLGNVLAVPTAQAMDMATLLTTTVRFVLSPQVLIPASSLSLGWYFNRLSWKNAYAAMATHADSLATQNQTLEQDLAASKAANGALAEKNKKQAADIEMLHTKESDLITTLDKSEVTAEYENQKNVWQVTNRLEPRLAQAIALKRETEEKLTQLQQEHTTLQTTHTDLKTHTAKLERYNKDFKGQIRRLQESQQSLITMLDTHKVVAYRKFAGVGPWIVVNQDTIRAHAAEKDLKTAEAENGKLFEQVNTLNKEVTTLTAAKKALIQEVKCKDTQLNAQEQLIKELSLKEQAAKLVFRFRDAIKKLIVPNTKKDTITAMTLLGYTQVGNVQDGTATFVVNEQELFFL